MPDRRDFLASSGSALSGAWLARFAPLVAMTQACASDAMREGRPFASFTEQEGADFDAFAARIVPSGETPGAREAGSVYFADQALDGTLSDLLPIVRGGLEGLTRRASEGYGATSFAELDDAQQDAIIGAVEQEDPGFFFMGRTLVVLGLVTNPEYGGNRDKVGWALIGFDDAYRHDPPFGYYDRNEHGASTGDGA
jgi:gluconate 2-dehydrogenase gamma chain